MAGPTKWYKFWKWANITVVVINCTRNRIFVLYKCNWIESTELKQRMSFECTQSIVVE